MAKSRRQQVESPERLPFTAEHYREWKRRQIVRMAITYLAPLVILIVYFHYRNVGIEQDFQRMHLGAIAEQQANTLDLFLSERRVNLANLIDHPRFSIPPTSQAMREYLADLQRVSDAFVDLGFFDSSGVQVAYAGPYPALESRNYQNEDWFATLHGEDVNFVITDIYLGFRQQLHFTIAVSRTAGDRFSVLRATLDPARMYEYIQSQQDAGDVITSIINRHGTYQLVNETLGRPLDTCPIAVPRGESFGFGEAELPDDTRRFAFRWLSNTPWALIVQSVPGAGSFFTSPESRSLLVSLALLLVATMIILNRAGTLVAKQKETDQTRAQLEHAAKLASVGELASGIAHEINNPLAVITEESGLLMDYTDPQFGYKLEETELRRRLDGIQKAAFRCRDITRKLLRFVRKTDFDLREHDIHDIIDGVIDDLLGPEIQVSKVKIRREYASSLPPIVTDANQLQQVILNIINNATDAIGDKPGVITIRTAKEGRRLLIAIHDTGCGMTPDQLDRVFLPFFTTKEVGKGTGLGLSVSYGIVRGLGGEIQVESTKDVGTTFTLVLPLKPRR
ncbi:histidine kinase [candidate division GN15 bacterium]|nr:histidine kinase [candidate division GN15 bacterium]